MDYELIKEFIEPELLILIPVLYALGAGLKKPKKIKDNFIPTILGVAGVILAGIWCFANAELSTYQQVATCLFVAITQGVLSAAGSVYVNQIVKQTSTMLKDSQSKS